MIVSAEDGPRSGTCCSGATRRQPVAAALGARDTCASKRGMPLYGHEIDEEANPFEAGLGRVVKLAKGEFAGSRARPRSPTGIGASWPPSS